MSLEPLKSDKLEYLSKEGETYLYANKKAFPRAFLINKIVMAENAQDTIDKMFNLAGDLRTTAISEDNIEINTSPMQSTEDAVITYYSPNSVIIEINSMTNRLLILTDLYYPNWKASLDGNPTKIYKVDFALRAVLVPAGKHKIEYKTDLL